MTTHSGSIVRVEGAASLPSVPQVRTRALARAAILETRVRVLRAVCAMTALDLACHRHKAAIAERRGRDVETQQHVEGVTTLLALAQGAVKSLQGLGTVAGGRLESAENEVRDLERRLEEVTAARKAGLESINGRIADIALERERAAVVLDDAMRALGARGAALHDLVSWLGLPEAADLLDAIEPEIRHARALTLLDAAATESRRAAEQLGKLGADAAYDEALLELMDAEENHARARRESLLATAICESAFRDLCRAQRRLGACLEERMLRPEDFPFVPPATGGGMFPRFTEREGSGAGAPVTGAVGSGPDTGAGGDGAAREHRGAQEEGVASPRGAECMPGADHAPACPGSQSDHGSSAPEVARS